MIAKTYLAALLAVLALAGCETMQGAGRDLQTAGAALSEQTYGRQPPGAAGGVTDPYAPAGAAPYNPGPSF